MVIWSDWLTAIADAMEVTQTQAGVMISLIFTILVVVIILIATRGKSAQITVPIGSLLMTVLFTFMGWLPVWFGSVIALVLAIFIAYIFSRW